VYETGLGAVDDEMVMHRGVDCMQVWAAFWGAASACTGGTSWLMLILDRFL